jgi:glycosyltransferase involved in cell wall biosynthesis
LQSKERRLARVSVIIPVYNGEKYITSTIQSVLQQSYANWELVIVNDGSTDRTPELCRSFMRKNVKIIDQPNRGLSEARNVGIRHSKGEYIAFLDADDIWLPAKLEKQVSFLDSHPLVGLVFCGSRLMDEEGKHLGIKQIFKAGNIKPADIFLLNPIKNGSVPMLRRKTLEDIRSAAQMTNENIRIFYYFDPFLSAAEDIDCWLRIALETEWQIWGIPDYTVYYRINQTGLSSFVDRYHSEWLKIHEKIKLSHPLFFREHAKLA